MGFLEARGSALTAQGWPACCRRLGERGSLLPSGGLHQSCAVCQWMEHPPFGSGGLSVVHGGESEDSDDKGDSWSPSGKAGSLLMRKTPIAGHMAGRWEAEWGTC